MSFTKMPLFVAVDCEKGLDRLSLEAMLCPNPHRHIDRLRNHVRHPKLGRPHHRKAIEKGSSAVSAQDSSPLVL